MRHHRQAHFPKPIAPRRRATTATELLVVLTIIAILSTMSGMLYVTSRDHGVLSSQAVKIERAFAAARALAIRENAPYQVAFWLGETPQQDSPNEMTPSWQIDQIQMPADREDTTETPTVIQNKIEVISLEPLHSHIKFASLKGGVSYDITKADRVYHMRSYRFYPDSVSDSADIHLIRKEADPDGENYSQIKLYKPTAISAIFDKQPPPQ